MELQSVILDGFRRFRKPTEILTNGKLVSLIGPNEAGKTSILYAIAHLGHTAPIAKSDISRGRKVEDGQVVITAKYLLEKDDMDAANIKKTTWYIRKKKKDGKFTAEFHPRIEKRNLSHRKSLLDDLERVRSNNKIWGRLVQDDDEIVRVFQDAGAALRSEEESLEDAESESIKNLKDAVSKKWIESDPAYFRNLSEKIANCLSKEGEETPEQFARSVIYGRLPKVLFFSNQERILEGSYDIPSLSSEIPVALDNLAKIANLNLRELARAHAEDDTPSITKMKNQANQELQKRFEESWSQSGIHVTLEIRNDNLEILVEESGLNYTRLAERSDGLRQFVALQSFTTCERADRPILLIDEAEIRLHYDAQADLIQMLSKQNVAPKIIYTTHSAGCLPEDLGNGVRMVSYDDVQEGESTSKVSNQFWDRDSGGLEPLLFGMGATTLAFFPIRKALLTEGESDMLLLPTMLREVLKRDSLSFQIVPGVSKTSGVNLPILARNGAGVAFALDFDGGGRELSNKIVSAGFDKSSIFFLKASQGKDYQVEDFVNVNVLFHAVNNAFARREYKGDPIPKSALKANGRMAAVKRHFCKKKEDYVPKVLIAYEILDYVSKNPDESILDKSKVKAFAKFAKDVLAYFERSADAAEMAKGKGDLVIAK